MSETQTKFRLALDALVEQMKQDRSILAAVLCGSLSHDVVWAKSDIDLVLVTVDDKKVSSSDREGLSLYADGINVHAFLLSRAEFRKTAEGAIRNSFMHSLLAKGVLLYTHDPTITDVCARLQALGDRDTRIQLLLAGCAVLLPVYKAHKWFLTRGDHDYSALWILFSAVNLARIEILMAGRLADREVLPQAMQINPAFFKKVYVDLLNQKKTAKATEAALEAVDGYLAARTVPLYGMVIDYLEEVAEVRSATEIEDHFHRNYGVNSVTAACEYLADRGIFGKAGVPVRLTKKSNLDVEELGFFHNSQGGSAWR